jgi:photoactive yellow protein
MQLPDIDPSKPLSVQTIRTLSKLTARQIDALPVGVIRTDLEGVVRAYNASESALSGQSAADVIGKSFFTEVAPCTNVQRFAGRFREGVRKGSLYETFPYNFEFEPKKLGVLITLYHESPDPEAWIFVSVPGAESPS